MENFSALLKRYQTPNLIPYEELLLTNEWRSKRLAIIQRDKEKCVTCGNNETEYIAGVGNIWYDLAIIKHNITVEQNGIWLEEEIEEELPIIEDAGKPYHFHVHHKFYVLNKLPWEYPDEALTTFCNWCHWDFHEKNIVPVYESFNSEKNLNYHPCPRCNGAGWLPEYSHVEHGVCFQCRGVKYLELIKSVS